jgi:thiamine transport system permease protein
MVGHLPLIMRPTKLRLGVSSRLLFAVPPMIFLAVFFVWPVVTIVVRGLRGTAGWDLSAFGEIFSDPSMRRVAWFTLWESVASTLLCLLVGLPGAALFARYRFRGKRLLWSALLVPFVLPTVVVGVAMLGVYGPGGVSGLTLSGTIWAILIAHVFFNYAVVVRTVGSAWATIGPSGEDAARMLGAGSWQVFRRVTLPLLRPAIASAASIVFLFSFTSFGIVLILGGIRQRTIEVEIYQQTARFLHLDVAAALTLVQLIAVVAILIWFSRSQDRRSVSFEQRASSSTERVPSGFRQRLFVSVNLAFMAVLLALPLAVLLARSFSTPQGWGFDFYRSLGDTRGGSTSFVAPIDALWNSLVFAVEATIIAVVLGACASWAIAGTDLVRTSTRWTRWADVALMIPLGTSAVTVGFGFLITFDEAPMNLRSSLWLVPLAQALVALPFVVRLLVPALRSIDPAMRESAAILGASPRRVWTTIDLPIVSRALAAAAGFAFAVSLGEFGATVFLARPDRPTVPVAIYRALGRPGSENFGQAMALSALLMVLTVGVLLMVDRLRTPGSAEF